jgi:simple sugar transport system ATP-binding protein
LTSILKAVRLGKQFPGVAALADVDLEIADGRSLALVGANGAGKSTLIKILTGYYPQYSGQIEIDSQPVSIQHPADARALGIQAVYQEVDTVLVPNLTVSENLLLGEFAEAGSPLLNWRQLHERAAQMMAPLGLSIDPRRRVEELVLHEKQMLVIARALSQRVRFLIFDEPTTSLSLREIERLFETIRSLKAHGVGILYISHRLMEIAEIADEIMVLRSGRKITQFPVSAFNLKHITEAMLGTAVNELYPPKPRQKAGDIILEASNLRSPRLAIHRLTAKRGEILGIAGLVGAGKTELLRALFGADPITSGEIMLDGQKTRINSPQDAVQAGIFLVPEERRAQGVLVEENIRKNVSLPFLGVFSTAFSLVHQLRERAHAVQIIDRLGVNPPNSEAEVKQLSGGNQQKVAIGKWLAGSARVMLFDEATQGIDLKAKHDLFLIARTLAEHAAVIYASSDIDEIVGIADRAVVMRNGEIAAELSGAALDRTLILEYATGARAPLPIAEELTWPT